MSLTSFPSSTKDNFKKSHSLILERFLDNVDHFETNIFKIPSVKRNDWFKKRILHTKCRDSMRISTQKKLTLWHKDIFVRCLRQYSERIWWNRLETQSHRWFYSLEGKQACQMLCISMLNCLNYLEEQSYKMKNLS